MKWTIVLLALVASMGDTARVKNNEGKDADVEQALETVNKEEMTALAGEADKEATNHQGLNVTEVLRQASKNSTRTAGAKWWPFAAPLPARPSPEEFVIPDIASRNIMWKVDILADKSIPVVAEYWLPFGAVAFVYFGPDQYDLKRLHNNEVTVLKWLNQGDKVQQMAPPQPHTLLGLTTDTMFEHPIKYLTMLVKVVVEGNDQIGFVTISKEIVSNREQRLQQNEVEVEHDASNSWERFLVEVEV